MRLPARLTLAASTGLLRVQPSVFLGSAVLNLAPLEQRGRPKCHLWGAAGVRSVTSGALRTFRASLEDALSHDRVDQWHADQNGANHKRPEKVRLGQLRRGKCE